MSWDIVGVSATDSTRNRRSRDAGGPLAAGSSADDAPADDAPADPATDPSGAAFNAAGPTTYAIVPRPSIFEHINTAATTAPSIIAIVRMTYHLRPAERFT